MVRMGDVWDRTTEVLAGRGAMIARIAALTMFLPGVIQDAVPLVLGTGGAARATAVVVFLLFVAATLVGSLALTAVSSDPVIDEPAAYRIATAAMPATVAIVLVLVALTAVLLAPAFLLLLHSGIDYQAAAAGLPQTNVSPGAVGGAALYTVVFSLFALWAGARLLPLYAVIVGERPGLGAIPRTFALTRGLGLRIVSVLILYVIVTGVAVLAVQSVVGLILRLVLGAEQGALATFLTAVAVGVATTAFGAIQPVFAARLYAAIRQAREGAATLG